MELYIWYNWVCPQKIYPPLDAYIFESKFDINKPKKYNDFAEYWKHTSDDDYVQGSGKYKFPDEMYFVVTYKKYKKIDFDYYDLRNAKIVSEDLLSFLNKNGIDDTYYEKAFLRIIDLNGQIVTDKNYFALRFWQNKGDQEYFNFQKETKEDPVDSIESYFNALDGEDCIKKEKDSETPLYPDIELKNYENGKNVFVLNDYEYYNYKETMIFTENVKDYILDKFCSPEIYKAKDFPKVYDNYYLKDPKNNKYRIYK